MPLADICQKSRIGQQGRTDRKGVLKRRTFHMMQGAAGAIIIVTLSPVDSQIVNGLFGATPQAFIKLIALALIGGYAGGSLLESSASQYAKRIDKIEEKQKILEEEAEKERDVVRSAEQILRGNKLSSSDIQEFQRELKEISSSKRWEIAYKADENRRQHWEKDKEPMERSLLIFQALVKTDEAETVHWWYGSLGYCLKDKRNPDYAEAAERLDTAIKIRGPETRSGAYEFNRAFCNIQLAAKQLDGTGSRTLKEQIRSDLKTARNFQRFKDIIDKDSTVQEWLEKDVGMRPT